MTIEVPTICPGSPELPDLSPAPGTFYLAPPLQHTRDRVYVRLRDAGWRVRFPAAGVMGVEVPGQALPVLLAALEPLMSEPEMAAGSAVFMEHGEVFDARSLFQSRPLSTWVARAEHEWLLEVIRSERIQIHYHPLVDARDPQRVFAYECLMRGVGGDGGVIAPGAMFRAAELADLEFHLDRLARVAAIRDSHLQGIQANLFINFRPTAIYDPAFCLRTTVGAVEKLGLDPRRIVFEVVETEAISDHRHLRHIVDQYRQGGFRIALDDLGAGYGSLNLLKDLEPDFVKIDRELIRHVHRNPGQATIVEAMVGMARNLGTTTVAEGVEERDEAEWLREVGVDLLQGFYFARPASPPPSL
ncbi:MAG: EAL domain-containing protein [Halorhodospira halophila]|uniref:EAL domain-containing protein n=1 Tax=Halorhodospira halophila TaxID=1053 RepID=UPI0026F2D7E2|nr:EAL domain-containing protein [Halorhodospira halophila]MCC3750701.1 EAL domain-containing protein [Halorhodospira halophila]